MFQAKPRWKSATLVVLSLSLSTAAQVIHQSNAGDADQFALELIRSHSETERAALLAAKKELITPALRRELVKQGNINLVGGRYAPALDAYRLAQAIAMQIDDQEGIAATSLDIGTVYYFQGSYDLALQQYQQAQSVFSAVGNGTEAAQALYGIGLVFTEQRKPNQALEVFQRALNDFQLLGNHEEMAKTLSSMGATYYGQGNYVAATKAFLRSAELNDTSDNLLQIADAFYMQREYEQALDYYDKSIKRFEAERNSNGLVSAFASAANSFYYLGKYDQALEYYQKSLGLDEKRGDQLGMAAALQGIGNVYRMRGDVGSALTSYHRSLKLAEEAPIKVSTANTLGSIGLVRATQGDHVQARDYFSRSLAQYEATDDKVGMARLLGHIGNTAYVQGDYPAALTAYQRGLALREAVGDQSNAANLLVGIGMTHLAESKYGEALASYEKARALYESLNDKPEIADTLTRIANAYLMQRDYARAFDSARRAVALARQTERPGTVWPALLEFGKAQRGLQQPLQASQSLFEAVAIVESMRGEPPTVESGTEGSGVPLYLALVDLLIEQNRVEEAFDYADRAKLQMLSDLLRKGNARINGGMSLQEQESERKLTNEVQSASIQLERETQDGHADGTRLSVISDRLRQASTAFVNFRRKLYVAHPQLKIDRGEPAALKPIEARELITDDHTALLEFAITEESAYLFVLTRQPGSGRRSAPVKGRANARETPLVLNAYALHLTNQELTKRVTSFRQSLARRDQSFQPQARGLYDLLLRPAQEQLALKTAIVIVPDGILWGLPFEALQPAADQFLIEQGSTAYAPSMAALRELRKARVRRASPRTIAPALLGFANPLLSDDAVQRVQLTYGGEELTPAPEQEAEVQSVRTGYGGLRSRSYSGASATKERLKTEKNYRALHFAAHGLLDDNSPLYSFIAMAGDSAKQDDGLLHVGEIFGFHSGAELAVLSGASMARGQVATGNAAVGLTWAWHVAGIPASVLSRWEIQSPGVSQMMTDFYGRLRSGRTTSTKAEALRQSELKLLHHSEYSHPYFWGGFMLIGDAR